MNISVCIIVKNENPRIKKTIDSCKNIAKNFFILDTGSNDGTQELLKSLNHNIILFEQEFIDFATSKNYLLEQTQNHSESCEFLLFLDSNDELKNTHLLNIDSYVDQIILPFHLQTDNRIQIFKRPSIIRKNKGFYFKYPVHEMLMNDNSYTSIFLDNSAYIYHNKNTDKSSIPRHLSDIHALQKYLDDHPNDPRCLFYLAQTYFHMGNYRKSLEYYQKRVEYGDVGTNENFHAFIYYFKLLTTYFLDSFSKEEIEYVIEMFLKFYKHKCETHFLVGVYYYNIQEYEKAFEFASKSTQFEKDDYVIEENVYDNDRWELLKKSEIHLIKKVFIEY